MLEKIFKNLWARRWRNGWLFAELIIVAVVAWNVIDPIIVDSWVLAQPMGFETNRVCMVNIATYPKASSQYKAENDSTIIDDYMRLREAVRRIDGVEYATVVPRMLNIPSTMRQFGAYLSTEKDPERKIIGYGIAYMPGTDYFETMGIKAIQGQSLQEVTGKALSDKQLLLTETAAKMLFGDNRLPQPIMQTGFDTIYSEVVGVLPDMKYRLNYRPIPMFFVPMLKPEDTSLIMLRVRDGLNINTFMERFRDNHIANLQIGNLYVSSIKDYDSYIYNYGWGASSAKKFNMHVTLLVFFFLSLGLGVIGAFWLQTKTRQNDVGVMKAYGASKWQILGMLLGEGVVLTTVTWAIGCFIYWNYARMEGIYSEIPFAGLEPAPSWLDSFSLHFTITSLVLYVVMLLVVLIGIYIPARNISRILPTEALRDE